MIRLSLILIVGSLVWVPAVSTAQDSPVGHLSGWLASDQRAELRDQPWLTQPLTQKQAAQAKELLWNDYVEQIKRERKDEWKNKVIKLDELEMKFDFRTFGKPGESGRSLYISMHGGGGAPARVNDQQWRNQIRLYEPDEGIYLAPRAPTDTWNLWHQGHIDKFFERLIQNAVALEQVDPNRVYIMGYSAGGDGVYQLAPRMADRLAAAAMMAGHPNDASPLGLRNIGFTLHMGGEDSAYNRNRVAAEWKERLANLHKDDPQGYQHEVVIHKGKGHWMDREDAVAVPWMAKFERDPHPVKIVWHQSGVTRQQYYWLAVDRENASRGANVIAERDGQTIDLSGINKINRISIRLDDEMVDLDQPVIIRIDGKPVVRQSLERNIRTLHQTLQERGDVNLMFAAELSVATGTNE